MGPLRPHWPWRPPPSRTEPKAVLALVLGLVSIGCFGPLAGLPAIVLGSLARRDIDQSRGALTGRAVAAAGIVSGLFGTGLGVVVVLWAMGAAFAPESEEDAPAVAAVATEAAPEPPPTLATAPPIATAPAPAQSGAQTYGSLEVIDPDDSRSLHSQLAEIVNRSRGRTVVLQTNARASAACAEVARALPDERMRRALADVTLVRVDVDEYETELAQMKLATTTTPWFYKLDARGVPTDAISADAFRADDPENMASALGKFVHRASQRRRGAR
ncbi:MAG: DUF4190 domain-containing protein [Myxococcales bacterium]|nr:DUF4190 domain-containing protein [Myxococcales bacterium]